MSVTMVVAHTDPNWYDFLKRNQLYDEINFWRPSATSFKALLPGELFLFKSKTGSKGIVGGGWFSTFRFMECFLAWEVFGFGNGAASEAEMMDQINSHREEAASPTTKIGCIVLNFPFFFEEQPIDVPNWKKGTQANKRYFTEQTDGRMIWDAVMKRLKSYQLDPNVENVVNSAKPHATPPRVGQSVFRHNVIENYDRRCALTRERTLPALEAAHIKPYTKGGPNTMPNGLLLRRDIHRLFDLGYVTIDHKMKFVVSGRIRQEFENGRDYYRLDGKELWIPNTVNRQPSLAALSWHHNNCYLG
ncbi:MAG: HNH endonuclease [Gammaproteobacteria bacterium]|nr:HNH endonuclease [Gammaproteobacteria bacterium]